MRRYGHTLVLDAYVEEVAGASPDGLADPLSGVTYTVRAWEHPEFRVTRRPDDAQFSEVKGYAAQIGAMCTMKIDLGSGEVKIYGVLERPSFKQCTGAPSAATQAPSLLSPDVLNRILSDLGGG